MSASHNSLRLSPTACRSGFHRSIGRRFRRDEEGAVLVESIVILPVMIVFLVGILEFGALLYAKLEVETGLRDAARYVSRCPEPISRPQCIVNARNVAVYGTIAPSDADRARARGWAPSDVVITPENFSEGTPIQASTEFAYPGSPLIGLLNIGATIPVASFHQERVVGW